MCRVGILKSLSLKYFEHIPYACTVLIYMRKGTIKQLDYELEISIAR